MWVTEGREIENYISGSTFKKMGFDDNKVTGRYVKVISLPMHKEFREDKVAFARALADVTTKEDLDDRLDVSIRLSELSAHIRNWNGMSM